MKEKFIKRLFLTIALLALLPFAAYPQTRPLITLVCDGIDDTSAFENAYAESLINKQPLFLPPGNCVISNLVLDAAGTSGPEADHAAWGLIGSGRGVTVLTGKPGSTGTMIQFGVNSGSPRSAGRAILKDLTIAGHSGYDYGVRMGTANTQILQSSIERVDVRYFTKSGAAGVLLDWVVSFVVDQLAAHQNYNGMLVGTDPPGEGSTTLSISNSRFRANDNDGLQVHSVMGLKTYNNVYEGNTGWGLKLVGHSGFSNGVHTLINDWYESNTAGGLYLTGGPGDTNAGGPYTFLGGVFQSIKVDSLISDDQGLPTTFYSPFLVSTVTLNISRMITFINRNVGASLFAGTNPDSIADIKFLTPPFIKHQGIQILGQNNGAVPKLMAQDITIPDNGTYIVDYSPAFGLYSIKSAGSINAAALFLGHHDGLAVTLVSNVKGKFSATEDNVGTINIYHVAGQLTLQNKTGGSISVSVSQPG